MQWGRFDCLYVVVSMDSTSLSKPLFTLIVCYYYFLPAIIVVGVSLVSDGIRGGIPGGRNKK